MGARPKIVESLSENEDGLSALGKCASLRDLGFAHRRRCLPLPQGRNRGAPSLDPLPTHVAEVSGIACDDAPATFQIGSEV